MSEPDGDAAGTPSAEWQRWRRDLDPATYDEQWAAIAREGGNPHGEADLVASYAPRSVLDGGCGTGRLSIELARRGIEVVGVDLDPEMIAAARAKAPAIEWHVRSLAGLDLGRTFDVVALAGNVIPFVEPGARAEAVAGCARHVAPTGVLIMGESLRPGWPTTAELDAWAAAAHLALADRWSTWDREPFTTAGTTAGTAAGTAAGSDYAVSVYRPEGT